MCILKCINCNKIIFLNVILVAQTFANQFYCSFQHSVGKTSDHHRRWLHLGGKYITFSSITKFVLSLKVPADPLHQNLSDFGRRKTQLCTLPISNPLWLVLSALPSSMYEDSPAAWAWSCCSAAARATLHLLFLAHLRQTDFSRNQKRRQSVAAAFIFQLAFAVGFLGLRTSRMDVLHLKINYVLWSKIKK